MRVRERRGGREEEKEDDHSIAPLVHPHQLSQSHRQLHPDAHTWSASDRRVGSRREKARTGSGWLLLDGEELPAPR